MILNFKQFALNESNSAKIEKIQGLFEEDLVKQQFIIDMFGRSEFGYMDDYVLESEKEHEGTDVWIEIYNPTKEALEAIDKDYKAFVAPFEKWVADNDLYNAEIMSGDETSHSPASLSFHVTLL